jgi:hypothetical protein
MNLLSKLTRWSKNKRLKALGLLSNDLLDNRENERCRLSSSCLRKTDDVLSL